MKFEQLANGYSLTKDNETSGDLASLYKLLFLHGFRKVEENEAGMKITKDGKNYLLTHRDTSNFYKGDSIFLLAVD